MRQIGREGERQKLEKKKEKVNEYEVDRKEGERKKIGKRKRQLMNMRQIERV